MLCRLVRRVGKASACRPSEHNFAPLPDIDAEIPFHMAGNRGRHDRLATSGGTADDQCVREAQCRPVTFLYLVQERHKAMQFLDRPWATGSARVRMHLNFSDKPCPTPMPCPPLCCVAPAAAARWARPEQQAAIMCEHLGDVTAQEDG